MGGFLLSTAAWTWTLLIFLSNLTNLITASAQQPTLFQDLGVDSFPDVTKINISQDEYTSMMSAYLTTRQQSTDVNSIPELITFYMVKQEWIEARSATRLKFPIKRSVEKLEVDNAILRILVPPQLSQSNPVISVQVRINQIMGVRRQRLIQEKTIYLSANHTKWCEFDITPLVQAWFDGDRNLGLELETINSRPNVEPVAGAISTLVLRESRRFRRSFPYYGRTDCLNTRTRGKRKCCRHQMNVKFAELRFPEMETIIQPKVYDAGFCQGRCPPNYNHATNHSRIQSLLHQMEKRKNASRTVPKACCAPSKLEPLEVLRVNPTDGSKMIMEKWDNMKVVECACS